MSLLSMLRSTCTLKRKSGTKDSGGGWVDDYADVSGYADVSCDIQPASGRVREQYHQQQLAVTHTIYFAEDVPARAGDQIVGPDGEIYQFQGYRPQAPGYRQWACVVDVERQYG